MVRVLALFPQAGKAPIGWCSNWLVIYCFVYCCFRSILKLRKDVMW